MRGLCKHCRLNKPSKCVMGVWLCGRCFQSWKVGKISQNCLDDIKKRYARAPWQKRPTANEVREVGEKCAFCNTIAIALVKKVWLCQEHYELIKYKEQIHYG